MEKKRSIGTTILGNFEILFGLLVSFGALWNLMTGPWSIPPDGGDYYSITVRTMFCGRILILGISLLVTGIGTLKLKRWAWFMNLIFIPLLLFYTHIFAAYSYNYMGGLRSASDPLLSDIDIHSIEYIISDIFGNIYSRHYNEIHSFKIMMLFNALLVYLPVFIFLTRPKVKEQFK